MNVAYAKLKNLTLLPNDDAIADVVHDEATRDKTAHSETTRSNPSPAHLHSCIECERWFLCHADPCEGGTVLRFYEDAPLGLGPVIVCEECG